MVVVFAKSNKSLLLFANSRLLKVVLPSTVELAVEALPLNLTVLLAEVKVLDEFFQFPSSMTRKGALLHTIFTPPFNNKPPWAFNVPV